MGKIYFIDSENVGDNWVSLLDALTDDDKLLVFFTQKSPHMNYRNLVLLKQSQKEVNFIECCEGNNALDFQLSTDLGFRICDTPDNEFIIVSNDTGYDAVVKYWKRRGISLRRVQGRDCAKIKADMLKEQQNEKQIIKKTAAITSGIEETVANIEESVSDIRKTSVITSGIEETVKNIEESAENTAYNTDEKIQMANTAQSDDEISEVFDVVSDDIFDESFEKAPDILTDSLQQTSTDVSVDTAATIITPVVDETAKELLFIVGKDNLQNLHNALTQIYGIKKAQPIYNALKSDTEYKTFLNEHTPMTQAEKQKAYCSIIFYTNSENSSMPDDFAAKLMSFWKQKKNLNSLRASLLGSYGKEKGSEYYSLVKAHIKILEKIK